MLLRYQINKFQKLITFLADVKYYIITWNKKFKNFYYLTEVIYYFDTKIKRFQAFKTCLFCPT